MGKSLHEFVHRQNVIRYLSLLRAAPEARVYGLLTSLLAEERASARVNGWRVVHR